VYRRWIFADSGISSLSFVAADAAMVASTPGLFLLQRLPVQFLAGPRVFPGHQHHYRYQVAGSRSNALNFLRILKIGWTREAFIRRPPQSPNPPLLLLGFVWHAPGNGGIPTHLGSNASRNSEKTKTSRAAVENEQLRLASQPVGSGINPRFGFVA